MEPAAQWTGRVRRALLAFFDERRRDLPWRRDRDPYRVWISEVMLQQTRVDVVIPYYDRWLQRFPALADLAVADRDDVLRAWQGLGYYARARNLHAAAALVMDRHGGRLPRSVAELRALPGIGVYVAGAIASIAFGEAVPAIDSNARRILARLVDDPAPAPSRLYTLGQAIIAVDRPGDLNQAFMDLGSLVCTPKSPLCGVCPLRAHCAAYARGTQHDRPAARARKAVPEYDVGTAIIVSASGRVLLVRRPEHGLLGGLWSFPGAHVRRGETPRRAAIRAVRTLGIAIDGRRARAIATVPHTFSHRKETYHAFRFVVERSGNGRPAAIQRERGAVDGTGSPETRWCSRSMIARLALPTAQRTILATYRNATD